MIGYDFMEVKMCRWYKHNYGKWIDENVIEYYDVHFPTKNRLPNKRKLRQIKTCRDCGIKKIRQVKL